DLPGVPVAVVAGGLVAEVAFVQPVQALDDPALGLLVAVEVAAGGAGGERDLVQELVRLAEGGVVGAEPEAGEQLAVAGPVHHGGALPGGGQDGGEFGRDLGAGVGVGGAGEHGHGVGEQPGVVGPGGGGGASGRGGGEQSGGGQEGEDLAA